MVSGASVVRWLMEYRRLGKTNIKVSRICFGTLTAGPLQANLPLEQGAALMAEAVERGINFFDTAQLYETYPYLRRAMEITGQKDIVISTKTYAYTRQLAEEALEQARRELNRDVVDIFMLHEQESIHTLRGHREALEYLLEQKQRGIIRAVGASMHRIAAVEGALQMELDVIHPLLNREGLGIMDGTRAQMEQAVRQAHHRGMGVFSMKPLGGGNLFRSSGECLRYAFSLPWVDSVALGMQSVEELKANLEFYQTGEFSPQAKGELERKVRHLHIDDWCEGCGICVERCGQKALSLQEGRAVCNDSRCLLCGYCASTCPAWAIKVV